MSDEANSVLPGAIFEGKYRVERLLGRGGMGEVYEATHTLLDKRVAVKVLLAEYAADPEMVGRVTREARAASATGHANIAMVTDMGWTGDRPFIVMELLEGQTLRRRIQAGAIGLRQAITWMLQILDALDAVHAKQIIHRDLKPANIMLVPDRTGTAVVKILDFGISKDQSAEAATSGQSKTQTGRIIGTPHFMAPEQARAVSDLDARVDVHAAGSVLYTMLCGSPPFKGKTVTATLALLMEGKFTPASRCVPGLPKAVDEILTRALAVDRELRYPSVRAMANDLEGLLHQRAPASSVSFEGPPSVEMGTDAPQFESVLPEQVTAVATPPTLTQVAVPTSPGAAPPSTSGLQLDVPDGWRPGQSAVSPLVDRRAAGGRINWGWWITVVLLIGVGVGVWASWDQLTGMVGRDGSAGDSGERILLLIDTTPRDAIVFVDGVQRDERPLELPRSEEHVKLRVVAEGYEPRVMQIQPTAPRRIKIDLKRLGKR
ncbi:MAG: serine/threonine-protein kinase [Myxococcota bacterium]